MSFRGLGFASFCLGMWCWNDIGTLSAPERCLNERPSCGCQKHHYAYGKSLFTQKVTTNMLIHLQGCFRFCAANLCGRSVLEWCRWLSGITPLWLPSVAAGQVLMYAREYHIVLECAAIMLCVLYSCSSGIAEATLTLAFERTVHEYLRIHSNTQHVHVQYPVH
jgi:hypothetical protein